MAESGPEDPLQMNKFKVHDEKSEKKDETRTTQNTTKHCRCEFYKNPKTRSLKKHAESQTEQPPTS